MPLPYDTPLLTPSENTKIVIAVAVPVGAVLSIVIAVLLCVLAYYCCAQRKPYAYRPLSDRATDEEGSGEVDRVVPKPLSGPPDVGEDKESDGEEQPDI